MKDHKTQIDEALEDLKPIVQQLEKLGFKNTVIDFDYFPNLEKISINIKAMKWKQ